MDFGWVVFVVLLGFDFIMIWFGVEAYVLWVVVCLIAADLVAWRLMIAEFWRWVCCSFGFCGCGGESVGCVWC